MNNAKNKGALKGERLLFCMATFLSYSLATLMIMNQNNLILLPNLFLHPAHHCRAALLNSTRFYKSIQWLSNPACGSSQFLS